MMYALFSWLVLVLLPVLSRGVASNRSSLARVLQVCRSSGCFKQHHHRPHNFVECSSVPHTNIGRTNCRYGYPPTIDLDDYDFVYDFNSMYHYDTSIFEGLAWAAPERVQFIHHAMLHAASRVMVLVPESHQRWTRGIVWALEELGIDVDEHVYNHKAMHVGEVTVDDVKWLRHSKKWIGLEQACLDVCKACFRSLTLAVFGVNAPDGKYIKDGHCNNLGPHPKAPLMDLPPSTINSLKIEHVLPTILRRPDYQTQQIECEHIAVIVRMGDYRAMVYPSYLNFPPRMSAFKERYHVKDPRMVEVFQARFGVDKVKVYYGNCTTKEMLDIFSNACAIVGPAGAAFGNVLFAQPYTYMLEINAYIPFLDHESKLRVKYESNIMAGVGTGVTWDIYQAGLDQLYPSFEYENITDQLVKEGNQPFFARIGYQSNYIFDMTDYEAMVEATCNNLKNLTWNIHC